MVERKAQDIKHKAVICPLAVAGFEIEGKKEISQSLTASLSCLFAWQVLTLGCFHSLIIYTAVGFGRGPEVVWCGWVAGFV